jgi:hypothetical protein
VEAAQRAVLEAVEGVQGRGKGGMTPKQQAQFEEAVAILEADGGVQVGCCTLHPAGASAFILYRQSLIASGVLWRRSQ